MQKRANRVSEDEMSNDIFKAQKVRLMTAGGHQTKPPASLTFSSVEPYVALVSM